MALVVKKFYADTTPNSAGNYVEIEARQSGLIAWVLSLLQIDPTFFMQVSYNEIVYQATTLAGYRKTLITTGSVSSSFYGYHKPIKEALIIVGLSLFFGYSLGKSDNVLAGLFLVLIGLIVAVIYYFLNKKLSIGFSEINGDDYGLLLKRSVIENTEINEEQMKFVADIISTVLRENRNIGNASASAAPAPTA